MQERASESSRDLWRFCACSDASVYFDHAHLRIPSSKAEIIEIVKWAAEKGQKVRVVGSGHSWSSVAVGDDIQISLWNLTGIVSKPL